MRVPDIRLSRSSSSCARNSLSRFSTSLISGLRLRRQQASARSQQFEGAIQLSQHAVIHALPVERGERLGREVGNIGTAAEGRVQLRGTPRQHANAVQVVAQQLGDDLRHRIVRRPQVRRHQVANPRVILRNRQRMLEEQSQLIDRVVPTRYWCSATALLSVPTQVCIGKSSR